MWYKELGFSTYPLDPRSNINLVGVEHIEQRLEEYITQGNMCLLCGFTGSGKTSMLKRVTKSPSLKQFEFIYLSADGVRKDHLIDDAIWDKRSFIKRLLRRKPKNLVILLDECHLANRILTESIKSKWNVEYEDGTKAIQSVIVSQIEDRLGTNFSGSFADRLGSRVVKMPKLSKEKLVNVLRNRLDNSTRNYADALSEDALELLIDSADGSVRQLLEYTDALFVHHSKVPEGNPLLDESYEVSKEAVFNILQAAELVSFDRRGKKEGFRSVLENPELCKAVEMFQQFGTLSDVTLAEKLNAEHVRATSILTELQKNGAIMFAHQDNGQHFYVLSPRLQHELTKA